MKFKETMKLDDIFGIYWAPGNEIPKNSRAWYDCLELIELGWDKSPNPAIHRHWSGHRVLGRFWVECE